MCVRPLRLSNELRKVTSAPAGCDGCATSNTLHNVTSASGINTERCTTTLRDSRAVTHSATPRRITVVKERIAGSIRGACNCAPYLTVNAHQLLSNPERTIAAQCFDRAPISRRGIATQRNTATRHCSFPRNLLKCWRELTATGTTHNCKCPNRDRNCDQRTHRTKRTARVRLTQPEVLVH
jgi:hypothetical protein